MLEVGDNLTVLEVDEASKTYVLGDDNGNKYHLHFGDGGHVAACDCGSENLICLACNTQMR
jgi:hypothetical protein